jgi:hypothetical protein
VHHSTNMSYSMQVTTSNDCYRCPYWLVCVKRPNSKFFFRDNHPVYLSRARRFCERPVTKIYFLIYASKNHFRHIYPRAIVTASLPESFSPIGSKLVKLEKVGYSSLDSYRSVYGAEGRLLSKSPTHPTCFISNHIYIISYALLSLFHRGWMQNIHIWYMGTIFSLFRYFS